MRPEELAERLRAGDRRALARALSLVEAGGAEGEAVLAHVYPWARGGHVVGLTGAPGVGKSTLTDALARTFVARGRKVGVLAVDPSSPFSGGALLGDRVRMDAPHPDVFIRSLATRGQVGGLSRATAGCIRLLFAAGKDLVLLETVGAGQSEVAVMGHAGTTVVVSVPGLGDDVQANKAGILEIGDVFVVNKADLPGADLVVRELTAMLSLGPKKAWQPPVLRTVATRGEGVEEVAQAILRHEAYLETSEEGSERTRRQAEEELAEAVATLVVTKVLGELKANGVFGRALAEVLAGRADPFTAARRMLAGEESKPWTFD